MAKVTYGAGPKPRRGVEKTPQDTTRVYGGSKVGRRYNTGDNATKKTKGYDSLTSENKERRGRSGSGKTKYKSKTTGSKARNRSTNRRNRAKSGGK